LNSGNGPDQVSQVVEVPQSEEPCLGLWGGVLAVERVWLVVVIVLSARRRPLEYGFVMTTRIVDSGTLSDAILALFVVNQLMQVRLPGPEPR
jgi:hypothetical protein